TPAESQTDNHDCPPSTGMDTAGCCRRRTRYGSTSSFGCKDIDVGHFWFQIHIGDVGIVRLRKPDELRQDVMGYKGPEFLPEWRAAAVVVRSCGVPAVLRIRRIGIVSTMEIPCIECV